MTRKGKQPGGHNPLTYHERSKLSSSGYGTTTKRLNQECHIKFGNCCLSLTPATNPVATPSGHIYNREAILSYLLTKQEELSLQKQKYENYINSQKLQIQQKEEEEYQTSIQHFRKLNQGGTTSSNPNTSSALQLSSQDHALALNASLSKKIDIQSKQDQQVDFKHTCYWLNSDVREKEKEGIRKDDVGGIPRERPASPMSGNDLRMKDLIPVTLVWEGGNKNDENNTRNSSSDSLHSSKRCVCAVSLKAITNQPVILIKKTGVVMLKEVYDTIIRDKNKSKQKKNTNTITTNDDETKTSSSNNTSNKNEENQVMYCPITGKKFKEKDVLVLQNSTTLTSVAKKYRPTLT